MTAMNPPPAFVRPARFSAAEWDALANRNRVSGARPKGASFNPKNGSYRSIGAGCAGVVTAPFYASAARSTNTRM